MFFNVLSPKSAFADPPGQGGKMAYAYWKEGEGSARAPNNSVLSKIEQNLEIFKRFLSKIGDYKILRQNFRIRFSNAVPCWPIGPIAKTPIEYPVGA